MKTVFIFSILVYFWGSTNAINPSTDEVILETVGKLHLAANIEEVQACVGKLERIAAAEPKRWEPQYYLAYSRIMLSFREQNGEKKDAILDQAELDIKKSMELGGDKSELNALQAYLYQGRIQVNAIRGMKYSSMAADALDKAIKLNPANARAHFLLGMNVYHTPKMFGGGAKKALPHFKKALECFDKSSGVKSIAPHWGVEITRQMIASCGEEE